MQYCVLDKEIRLFDMVFDEQLMKVARGNIDTLVPCTAVEDDDGQRHALSDRTFSRKFQI